MKRVLIIPIHGLGLGGIGVHIFNYMHGFVDDNWSVDIVNDDENADVLPKQLQALGCTIINVRSRRKALLSYMLDVKRVMRKFYYNIVHIHGNSETMAIELYLAKSCHIPIRIVHSHNVDIENKLVNIESNGIATVPKAKKSTIDFFRSVVRSYFRCSFTGAFACSHNAGLWLYGDIKFDILPNCINTNCFKFNSDTRQTIRKRHAIHDSTLIIGNIGHHSIQKNQAFLIEVAALLPSDMNFEIWLVGDGLLVESNKEKSISLGVSDKIKFLGSQYSSEYLQAFDIFALPSLYEGFCIALLEAQASGLKCIANQLVEAVTVTIDVTYLPLVHNDWVETISHYTVSTDSERHKAGKAIIASIRENGYDTIGSADRLKQLYSEISNYD